MSPERLRVAMDARRLQDEPYTGVGRRMAYLLPYIAAEVDLVLLTDKGRPSPRVGDYEEVRLALPRRLREPFWLQISVAKWLRHFDGIFHGTYNALPLFYRGPAVVNIHDLSFEHHPEDMTTATRWSLVAQARLAARAAAAVITNSEHARQSLIATYHLAPDRVLVSPPSVGPEFSPDRVDDLGAVTQRLGIERPYVVAIGGAKRRGLEVAVAAWQQLPPGPDRPMLVVVGSEAPPPGPGIVHAGRVNDAEWSALLAGAQVFCYPTRFEGYGMPALEAAASGVPVVCARLGPLPEVLGDAAQWCEEPTVASIGAGLAALVADPARRADLRTAGLAQAAAAMSWADSAAVELAAYRMAAR